jgi:hypothetical protein
MFIHTVVLLMFLEIIQAQSFVEEQGEGKWLQPFNSRSSERYRSYKGIS